MSLEMCKKNAQVRVILTLNIKMNPNSYSFSGTLFSYNKKKTNRLWIEENSDMVNIFMVCITNHMSFIHSFLRVRILI